jgi:hypothetical protein
MVSRLTSEKLLIPAGPDLGEKVYQEFLDRGWTDGLPVIPPTEEAVDRAVTYTGRDPQDVLAYIPPRWGEATVEKIAINAIMAGCFPEYLPVIIAAVEAMAEARFNLFFVQTTTHPCAPLLIVNGPIAKDLGINCHSGAFGPYYRSNATIGRAIRLILINIGGAIPGTSDMATQGQPCKYSFCIAENEAENPWEPLHVERGFKASASTVTVVASENPHNIGEHCANSGEDLLITIAGSMIGMGTDNMKAQGGNPVLALGPEHAATLARDGYSKEDIKSYIHENARVPRSRFIEGAKRRYYSNLSDDALVPIAMDKQDLIVIVVGGPGKHSSYLPTAVASWAVTKPIV